MAKRRDRKSVQEAQAERFTWFLMVLVFAILYILPPEDTAGLPNFIVPFCGTVILLGSGVYQYRHGWHVSPVTWIAGTLLFMLVLINLQVSSEQDFYGITLLTFAGVIGFGVLTGET